MNQNSIGTNAKSSNAEIKHSALQLIFAATMDETVNIARQAIHQKSTTVSTTNNYCWTHGCDIGDTHTSATCNNRKPGHITTANGCNNQGGTLLNKDKSQWPSHPWRGWREYNNTSVVSNTYKKLPFNNILACHSNSNCLNSKRTFPIPPENSLLEPLSLLKPGTRLKTIKEEELLQVQPTPINVCNLPKSSTEMTNPNPIDPWIQRSSFYYIGLVPCKIGR